MYPTQLHSYLLWRSSVDPDSQTLASARFTCTVALFPAAMVGIFVFGWYAALVLVATVGTAFATDFICHRWIWPDSHGTRDGTWLLAGLVIGLMCPPNVPLWLPILGAVAAMALGKFYFSVDAMPLLQPAAVGLLTMHLFGLILLTFSASNPMAAVQNGESRWPVLKRGIETSSEEVRAGGVSKMLRDFFGGDVRKSVSTQQYRESTFAGEMAKTPEGDIAAAQHGPRPIDLVDANPSRPVNAPADAKVEAYDWIQMLLGYVPATIGGSSGLALGFGILLIVFSGAVSVVLPLFALGAMFAALTFLSWMYGAGPGSRVIWDNVPIHLLTGSTLIGIFYMAADPAIAPRSVLGKAYAGVLLGVLEVALRAFTPLSEGIVLSALLIQGLSYVFDTWLAPPADGTAPVTNPSLTTSSLGRL